MNVARTLLCVSLFVGADATGAVAQESLGGLPWTTEMRVSTPRALYTVTCGRLLQWGGGRAQDVVRLYQDQLKQYHFYRNGSPESREYCPDFLGWVDEKQFESDVEVTDALSTPLTNDRADCLLQARETMVSKIAASAEQVRMLKEGGLQEFHILFTDYQGRERAYNSDPADKSFPPIEIDAAGRLSLTARLYQGQCLLPTDRLIQNGIDAITRRVEARRRVTQKAEEIRQLIESLK